MIGLMEKTGGPLVRWLRSETVTGLLINRFHDVLSEKGITQETPLPYTLGSNGKAEHVQQKRMTGTGWLLEVINFVLDHYRLWDEVVLTANYM